MRLKTRALQIIFSQSSLFILINLFVHAVNFIRSFVFMRILDLRDLGMISLIQTCIMFIGLLHLGFFQGGYRILAYKKEEDKKGVNNTIFTFLACLSFIILLLSLSLSFTDIDFVVNRKYLLLTAVAGIFSLTTTWLTNTMTVKRMIAEINWINAASSILSIGLIPLVYVWGITGGILSIMIQPIVFVMFAMIKSKELRPTSWSFEKSVVSEILRLGFIPFLVGIFAILNIQIERWSIAYLLDVEELGRFYLVFIFSSLFILIPTSINYLFFPKIIHAYEHGMMEEFRKQNRNYTLVLAAYGISVLLLVFILFQPVIDILFPAHSGNTHYVFSLLPGLLFNLLYYSVSSILNAWKDFTSLLLSGIIGISSSIAIIAITARMGTFNLDTMVLIKNISYTLPVVFGATYIYTNRKKLFIK